MSDNDRNLPPLHLPEDHVICPRCAHDFHAVSQASKAEVAALRAEIERLTQELAAEQEHRQDLLADRCTAHGMANPEGDCVYCDHEQATDRAERAERERDEARSALRKIADNDTSCWQSDPAKICAWVARAVLNREDKHG